MDELEKPEKRPLARHPPISDDYAKGTTEIGVASAYMRLKPHQRAYIDTWIKTGDIEQALEAAGRSPKSRITAWTWLDRNPDFTAAIVERCEQLREFAPEHIASMSEVLRELTYLMRHGSDESTRLKAALALAKHYNPRLNATTLNIDLKALLEEAEKVSVSTQERTLPSR